MLNISEDFMTAAEKNTRQISLRAYIGDTLITGENIIDLTVTEALNSSDGISMGATIASKLVMTIKAINPPLVLIGNSVRPEMAFNGLNEWVKLGKFYITDAVSNNDFKTTFTITAYDGFSKTEKAYTPKIPMPNTAYKILNDIAEQCGLTTSYGQAVIDGVLISEGLPYADDNGVLVFAQRAYTDEDGVLVIADGISELNNELELYDFTCRQYIGYIAGLAGKNARFDREGNLTFTWYKNSDYSIRLRAQYMGGCKLLTEQEFTVHSITSGSSKNTITSGSGVGFSFENPFMTQEALDAIFSNIGAPSYTPMQVKWRGNPAIEPGDIITVEDRDENFRTVYVMEQTLRVSGGLYSEIKCYGDSDAKIAFNTSPTSKKIQQVYTKLQEAIAEATKLMGGSNGGIFEIIDEDGDGINDGWIIHSANRQQYIKANVNGIGITRDGGATYEQAMTTSGINASAITTGSLNAERIAVENYDEDDPTKLTDYIRFGNGTITLGRGDSAVILKLENDQVAFYNTNGVRLMRLTNNSFEIENLEDGQIRFQNFGFIPRASGNLSFTKLK